MSAGAEYETFQRACGKCGALVDHTEKRAAGRVVGVSVTQHPCRARSTEERPSLDDEEPDEDGVDREDGKVGA